MSNRPAEPIPRHCMNIHCRKCRARARRYRRKAWHATKPLSAAVPERSDRR